MTDQPTLPPAAPTAPSATATTQAKTSGAAMVSLVFGILTWFSVPLMWMVVPTPLCAIIAIVAGHMARAEIRRSQGRVEGNGLAIAGLVLGWSVVVLTMLAILVAIVFLGGIAALVGWLGVNGQLH
jgi:hypothetical protein